MAQQSQGPKRGGNWSGLDPNQQGAGKSYVDQLASIMGGGPAVGGPQPRQPIISDTPANVQGKDPTQVMEYQKRLQQAMMASQGQFLPGGAPLQTAMTGNRPTPIARLPIQQRPTAQQGMDLQQARYQAAMAGKRVPTRRRP